MARRANTTAAASVATSASKVLEPKRMIRIGGQTFDLEDIQEVQSVTLRMVIASGGPDFKATHPELSNGALIGTLVSIDQPLKFSNTNGEPFEMNLSELLDASVTLMGGFDMVDDITEEIGEFPLGLGGGRAGELTVTVDMNATLTNSTVGAGISVKPISTQFVLSGVSREKKVESKSEALEQIQQNIQRNRGVRQERIRESRAMRSMPEAPKESMEAVVDSALPLMVEA